LQNHIQHQVASQMSPILALSVEARVDLVITQANLFRECWSPLLPQAVVGTIVDRAPPEDIPLHPAIEICEEIINQALPIVAQRIPGVRIMVGIKPILAT